MVTGVQTCALPISDRIARAEEALAARRAWYDQIAQTAAELD